MDFSKYIDEQKLIEAVRNTISVPSVSEETADSRYPYGENVFKCLRQVLDAAEEMGFTTGIMDNRVGWCEWGQGDEMVAVVGHLDTVPIGNGWTKDPYKGEIADGKLYGRGAIDDKGPIISAVFALKALKDSGFKPSKRIRILFGCNEEAGCDDMEYYVKHGGEIPVSGFTPDGAYPLINGEKGLITEHYEYDISDSEIESLSGGTAENMVPDCAEARLKNGAVFKAEGIGAHGSTPEKGKNAIIALFKKLAGENIGQGAKNAIDFLLEKIGDETDGKSIGAYLEDKVSGALTLTLGTAQSDGRKLDISINYRYPVTKSYEDCAEPIHRAFEKAKFRRVSSVTMKPLYFPEDDKLVKTLLGVYEECTGEKAKPISIGGGTYAKCIPNIVAFGPIFPGETPTEHEPDEYISVDKLIKVANMNAMAMYELSK